MKLFKSDKELLQEKEIVIKELQTALKTCITIWGKGYAPKGDIAPTTGSLLYLECEKLLK